MPLPPCGADTPTPNSTNSPRPRYSERQRMPAIRSLKPNVTRDDAISQFSSRGPSAIFRNLLFGPLRSVAELYIPFRLFRVRIINRGIHDERLVALDGVTGSLDLYQFDHLPTEAEWISLETRNCPPAKLSDTAATELVVAKLRRVFYSRGFFKMRDLEISAISISEELHIPYWLGFRGTHQHARFAVLDAVRRRPEGAKVRRLVEEWLTARS